MKWNFLYQNTAASRTPDWGGGYCPPDHRSLCPQLNLLKPPPPGTKFMGTPMFPCKDVGWFLGAYIWEKITSYEAGNTVYISFRVYIFFDDSSCLGSAKKTPVSNEWPGTKEPGFNACGTEAVTTTRTTGSFSVSDAPLRRKRVCPVIQYFTLHAQSGESACCPYVRVPTFVLGTPCDLTSTLLSTNFVPTALHAQCILPTAVLPVVHKGAEGLGMKSKCLTN